MPKERTVIKAMNRWQSFIEKIRWAGDAMHERHEEARRKHEEAHKLHEALHIKNREFHRQQDELMKRLRELQKQRNELSHYQKHIRLAPVFILIVLLVIWYLIFHFAGFEIFGVFIALLFSIGGIFQLFFLRRIESRIIKPLDRLATGIEEITKGNYDVQVENDAINRASPLIASFNDMARKLRDDEKTKTEYEENRKALIANISHDLKTPITSIQGYIEAILDGNPAAADNIDRYLKIIYNNAAYINKLVDDLFLFSKLDMQKLEFSFEKVPVVPFITDSMEEFKLELEEMKLGFDFRNELQNDRLVNIDRKRMHQVLRNIIGNAVKYGSGSGKLSISARLYAGNGEICLDISDNGPGISEDKLAHIFERFYRIDTERTKDFTSTGLGLAISKELVEAHGGSISVSSAKSEGACFTIKLPAVKWNEEGNVDG